MSKIDHTNFTNRELQILTCLVGSRKELGLYLGLTPKELDLLWKARQLKSPTQYVKDLVQEDLVHLIFTRGSVRKAANHLGVSTSFLQEVLKSSIPPSRFTGTGLDEGQVRFYLERYRSIRLATRMMNEDCYLPFYLTETEVRELAVTYKLELSTLLDWSQSNHSAGRGRRAELDYAELRGEAILRDENLAVGSHAEFDFLDRDLGKVNVKSSRQYRFKARTRKDNSDYWKFSLGGRDKADYFVFLAYEEGKEKPVGFLAKCTAELPKNISTLTITRLELSSCLTYLQNLSMTSTDTSENTMPFSEG